MPRDKRRRERQSRQRPNLDAAGPSAPRISTGPMLAGRRVSPARDWRWRTFPVFFTFAVTVFASAVLGTIGFATLLLLVGIVALAAGMAHLVSIVLVAPRLKPPTEPRQ